jgi:hypothetical protein
MEPVAGSRRKPEMLVSSGKQAAAGPEIVVTRMFLDLLGPLFNVVLVPDEYWLRPALEGLPLSLIFFCGI